jgi:hypothetical protein
MFVKEFVNAAISALPERMSIHGTSSASLVVCSGKFLNLGLRRQRHGN